MKLTIENVDRKRWEHGWVVEYCKVPFPTNDEYHFNLKNPATGQTKVGIMISRTPSSLTTKTDICYKVSICYETWGQVIHKEDVSLSTLKKGVVFWNAVTDWLEKNLDKNLN